jgi:ATP-binding cassette subfamily G (WHITE) protein 2 (PDR)
MAQDGNVEYLPPDDSTDFANLASTVSHKTTFSHASRDCGSSKQATVDEIEDESSILDPLHPGFDAYKWVSSMIATGRNKGLRQRKISILFQNLNVYGNDEASGFQKTVGFSRRTLANIWRSMICARAKRTIFRQFEGVLRNGEMLLVLGRPGSGCSTLLKTISGNVHGLIVDPHSDLQYNGATIPST